MAPSRRRPALLKKELLIDSDGEDELAAAPQGRKRSAPAPSAAPAAKKRAPAAVSKRNESDSEGDREHVPVEAKKRGGRQRKPAGRGGKKEVVAEEAAEEEAEEVQEVEVVVEKASTRKTIPRGKAAAPKPRVASAKPPAEPESESEPEPEPEPESPPPVKKAPAQRKGRAAPQVKKFVCEVAETQFESEPEVAPTPTQVHSSRPEKKRDASRFQLEEIRELEAERALEQFKRNSEKTGKEAENLIKTLQKDLQKKGELADESKALKQKLAAKDAEIAKLQQKVAELTKSVSTAQKENQVLSAKLTAAQQTKSQVVPGSAVKNNGIGRGIIPSGGNQDWILAAKEVLYGDLTNLVIMGVKQEAEVKVFECLQTGINGTLHFHLHVRDITAPKKSKAPAADGADGDDVEEDEYVFVPKLDEKRDSVVISLLPEYLHHEITFAREHAARFYHKINTVLMRQPVVAAEEASEDESDEEGDETMATALDGDDTIADTTMGDAIEMLKGEEVEA